MNIIIKLLVIFNPSSKQEPSHHMMSKLFTYILLLFKFLFILFLKKIKINSHYKFCMLRMQKNLFIVLICHIPNCYIHITLNLFCFKKKTKKQKQEYFLNVEKI